MKTTWLIIVIPVVLCGLSTLQGCATQPIQSGSGVSTAQSPGAAGLAANSNLSAEEKGIREQSSSWFTASNAGGCLAGAAVGAGVGAVASGKLKDFGTLIGALGGCIAGIGVNMISQAGREQFATQEESKEELLSKAQEENEKTRQYIITANQVIATDFNKIAAVQENLNRKQISLEQARQQLQKVDQNIVVMNHALSNMKSHESQLREAAAGKSPDPVLDGEIARYKGQIFTYESELNRLVQRRVMTNIPSYEGDLNKSVQNQG